MKINSNYFCAMYVSNKKIPESVILMLQCASSSHHIYEKMYLYLVQSLIVNKNLDLTQMSIHHFDIECTIWLERRRKNIVNQTDTIKFINLKDFEY